MTMTIDMNDETNQVTEAQQQDVIQLIDHAAAFLGLAGEIELSLTFVTNARIHEINRDYRHIDRPTDVISFALEEMGEDEVAIVPEDDEPRVLGDIIVSIEKTKEQAESYGHSFERELGFLVIHGLLHLLGYDHMNEEDEKKMFGLQEEILSSYGLSRS
ncbi:rRNA maturation RNase YbeY [Sporolactobacillus spathodeae]|uniref:Endoribonuclease YbeY n=1 Tax=Sporolactobacillus spathodeae TaxID=1465502 RepID=A0ABS2Q6C6_9BACL|nr:rRNA maturation RNase YbeY [Sporolactobacillus spathodeae]MBM7657338.1 putative rRNA maturation factor [Sporolactobacillus spathodeae]